MSVIDSIFHHRGRGGLAARASGPTAGPTAGAPARQLVTSAPLLPCECCGGTRHEAIATRRGLTLRRCRDCGDVFVFPIPAQLPLSGQATLALTPPPDAALVMDNMLLRHGIASGKFLEITVAAGAAPTLASMARLSWDVTAAGIDDASQLVQASNFAADSFDVVYVGGGAVARAGSPRKLLGDLRRILRPRGLLVLRTPNARSGFAQLTLAAARVAHGTWIHSQAPHHLHEFTRRSLRVLLESLGYEIAWSRAERSSGLLPRGGTAAEAAGGSPAQRVALAPVRAMGAVLDILSRGGNELFVGARKPAPLHYGAPTS